MPETSTAIANYVISFYRKYDITLNRHKLFKLVCILNELYIESTNADILSELYIENADNAMLIDIDCRQLKECLDFYYDDEFIENNLENKYLDENNNLDNTDYTCDHFDDDLCIWLNKVLSVGLVLKDKCK